MGFLDKLKAKISSSSSSSSSKKSENGDSSVGTGSRHYVPRTYANANTADTSENWNGPTKSTGEEGKKDGVVSEDGGKRA